jgi:iron complex transport system substrate-binding protein
MSRQGRIKIASIAETGILSRKMRIASLVPSSTEMLFELGLGDQVVAVTHECDWPPEAESVPKLTSSVIPDGLPAGEIDRVVRETVGRGEPLYLLDRDRLAELDPELIVTQAVCEVCAVSYDDVVAVAATLPSRPRVVSLDPLTLEDVLGDVTRLGEAAHAPGEASALLKDATSRLDAVAASAKDAPRPRVLALEWLDPPFVAGHWVPQMIELANGIDALGRPGERSRTADWDELYDTPCDVAIVTPCGYDAERSAQEARAFQAQLDRLQTERLVAVDAAAYFSRPGPRLVTGIELLAHILHPGLFARPDGTELVECGRRDSNPHGQSPPAPKAGASTSSATPAHARTAKRF